MNDLIIIGGGPSALAAAAYAMDKNLDFAVVMNEPGGWVGWHQTLTGQGGDEYLAGEEAVKPLEQRVRASRHVVYDRVTDVAQTGDLFQVTMPQHEPRLTRAVLVATGATANTLIVPGAREFMGHGLAYSIATHAHLLTGKTVAVIGNTLRAFRGVAELAQTAQQVYVIVPYPPVVRSPLVTVMQQRANVEIVPGAQIKEVAGSQNVEELVVAQSPGGDVRRLPVDAVFADLGLHANSGPVRNVLDLAPGQFIGVDEHGATRVPGLFAAGDVTTTRGEQILIALGDGARAALSAYEYILAHKLQQPADR
jgi:thioredoxin reductase